ncbi:MAG: ABC transporter substrate-binding protein [Planctomycetes bacterium]|nr:ABC transporter substrate-binding protein [Planctomycetota bacterium]
MSSPTAPLRVASLLPAATEIVAALGAADRLVGVSHECDWPAAVRGLPVLTRPRVGATGTSREIHDAISKQAVSALAVYDVDLVALAAARPDVIVTQDLCDVCAVPFDAVRRAIAEVGLESTKLVSLKPLDLKGIWRSIDAVAEALELEDRGHALVEQLQARMQAVHARARRLPRTPRVLTIEWLDPVMIGATWMPELVQLAGGRPLVAQTGQKAPVLDARALAKLSPAPDIVVLKPCGFTLARSLMEIETITRLFEGLRWPACDGGEIFLCDGNAYFNRPGPRIVESLEILAACVHSFDFRDLGAKHAASFQRLGVRRGRV